MSKHARSDQVVKKPSKKVAKATASCKYCKKNYTERGLPLHQKTCAVKKIDDSCAAKKIRSYKFCILTEAIHESILSFLSNQTLTKMQYITGDRFQECEPSLARYCCKCEDDNPVVKSGLCRWCAASHTIFFRAMKSKAKRRYGMRETEFSSVVSKTKYYEWSVLEAHLLKKFGSKISWLRQIAKLDRCRKKASATRNFNLEMRPVLLYLTPEFAAYLKKVNFITTDQELLEQCSARFVALKAKLEESDISFRANAAICKAFITTGQGSFDDLIRALSTQKLT